MNFHIPIITNSYYNLSKFDFSFIDVTIYYIKSPEFKKYNLIIDKQEEDDSPTDIQNLIFN